MRRLTTYLVAVVVIGTTLTFPTVALAYPQANDSFAAAEVIEGDHGVVFGENLKATKEAGEPAHAGNAGGASLWYRWVAVEDGEVAFTAFGGFDESRFDPLLAVYTGASVDALTEIASNDDWRGFHSQVKFEGVAGTEYQIAVDGYAGDTGAFELVWAITPGNDDFAEAIVIEGTSGETTGSNRGATDEAGEPEHADCGFAAVWYQWTAPETESFRFDTRGSNYDTTLAVYTGTTVDALTLVAQNDDFRSLDSDLSFEATAGTTYSIAVGGCGGSTGDFTLRWDRGAIIFGTRNAEALVGTPGRDYIDARGGNDVVRGLGGNDFLFGGRGGDELFGGAGNDMLDSRDGRGGNDLIVGGAGEDTARADRGDVIRGVP